jgi:hypothetical protein
MNSVVILFIADLDELFYKTLKEANQHWMERLLYKREQGVLGETVRPEKDDEEDSLVDRSSIASKNEVQCLKDEIQGLRNADIMRKDEVQSLKIQLQEQNDIVNKLLAMTQDDKLVINNSLIK